MQSCHPKLHSSLELTWIHRLWCQERYCYHGISWIQKWKMGDRSNFEANSRMFLKIMLHLPSVYCHWPSMEVDAHTQSVSTLFWRLAHAWTMSRKPTLVRQEEQCCDLAGYWAVILIHYDGSRSCKQGDKVCGLQSDAFYGEGFSDECSFKNAIVPFRRLSAI